MLLRVQRYSLRHNGKTYRAGDTVDLPEALARRLAAKDPKTYALIGAASSAAEPVKTKESAKTEPVKDTAPDFDAMTVAKLKAYAADHGVKLPHKATRGVILAILRGDSMDSLPAVDLTEMVK